MTVLLSVADLEHCWMEVGDGLRPEDDPVELGGEAAPQNILQPSTTTLHLNLPVNMKQPG